MKSSNRSLNSIISALTAFLAAILCFSSNLWAYSGGTGDPNVPYQIANVVDFNQLTLDPNNWNKAFILTANIDLSGVLLTQIGISGKPFSGIFDGNYHVISNALINQPTSNNIGLFRNNSGQIRNLGIVNVNMTGNSYVGGLIASNAGSITNCYMTGSVIAKYGYSYAGGIAGSNGGSIKNCYAAGSVSGSGSRVGGLLGWNVSGGSLNSCYATGSVSGTHYVGGLAGSNANGSSITNCYATGSVNGGDAAGLAGANGGTITHCYATGLVHGTISASGLVYDNQATITGCFWDVNSTGLKGSNGGTGKTTAEMMMLSTFESAGWDFIDETANGTADIWRMCVDGVDYPKLNWQSLDGDLACPDGVNFVDYAEIAAHWGQTGCPTGCENADISNDGTVDINDLMVLSNNWLAGI